MFVFDEVHRYFDRTPGYRDCYTNINAICDDFDCPVVALTATLTEEQLLFIKDNLVVGEPYVTTSSFLQKDIKLDIGYYTLSNTGANANDTTCLDEEICEVSCSINKNSNENKSRWQETANKLKDDIADKVSVIKMDFREDVWDMQSCLQNLGLKDVRHFVGGGMEASEKEIVTNEFMTKSVKAFLATEAFLEGVDNPQITDIHRIGAPRKLNVAIQEMGRAGRGCSNGYYKIQVNEYEDDKRVGTGPKAYLKRKTFW